MEATNAAETLTEAEALESRNAIRCIKVGLLLSRLQPSLNRRLNTAIDHYDTAPVRSSLNRSLRIRISFSYLNFFLNYDRNWWFLWFRRRRRCWRERSEIWKWRLWGSVWGTRGSSSAACWSSLLRLRCWSWLFPLSCSRSHSEMELRQYFVTENLNALGKLFRIYCVVCSAVVFYCSGFTVWKGAQFSIGIAQFDFRLIQLAQVLIVMDCAQVKDEDWFWKAWFTIV